ncbi:uncharacterized protein LOC133329533 [Musca vetustissima]|uniref:uncharacterized protein LOC133329533 n=1 Tax=Musca vetustissima TaxID=27455 RepID=UPI002AB74382|nr:uncharacterized protein LOC133329533 [Musca vetustissima]
MADNNNNNQITINSNQKNNNNTTKHAQQQPQQKLIVVENEEILTKLSPKVLQAYEQLVRERTTVLSPSSSSSFCSQYVLTAKPVSGVGENSYGLIMQVCVRPMAEEQQQQKHATNGEENDNSAKETEVATTKPSTNEFYSILKLSPKNPAFRDHSHIPELYHREVFLYQTVFDEFRQLCAGGEFDIVPEMWYSCLDYMDEFLICEDLGQSGHRQNVRTQMPTIDLASATFRSIAKFHAMSFILQSKKPQIFRNLIKDFSDNLFNENIDPITIEFGKKYIRKTRVMLEQDMQRSSTSSSSSSSSILKQIEALQKLEDNFKEVSMQCVNGAAMAPYAVICHGDFWNNNMLYKYDDHTNEAVSAKLIDFQLSRYASPVVDLMHYLCTSTDHDLRRVHFNELLDIYYAELTRHIEQHQLQMEDIYPKKVFFEQLHSIGIFGLCMAAFSIPFFISNSSELPDLDEVATAIRDISSSSSENSEEEEGGAGGDADVQSANAKRQELLDEYDLLTERTLPIFKKRMCGLVRDLQDYGVLEVVMKL